ncbi:unnamed protein product [Musa acuminata var. zebrina]
MPRHGFGFITLSSRLLPIPAMSALRCTALRRPFVSFSSDGQRGCQGAEGLFRVAAEGRNGLKQDDDGGGGVDLGGPPAAGFQPPVARSPVPDPENIAAVALTGLLTWASVQVLFQLFVISVAILLAAVKYSFVAALLLIILITLL